MEPIRTERYDVVIIGGGISGTCAAVAAARKKLRVLLVEKYGFLGGSATAAMQSPWQGFFAGGKKIVGGIADEIVDRLVRENGSPGHRYADGTNFTPFDIEPLKYLLQELTVESGVTPLFHAEYIGCTMNGRSIDRISVHCREGIIDVRASVFIDATGTGDVAIGTGARAHAIHTPASYRFSMTGVDVPALRAYVREQRREFDTVSMTDEGDFFLQGFHSLAQEWYAAHEELHRSSSIEICSGIIPGNVLVSMIRIPHVDPSVIESITGAGILSQTMPAVAGLFLIERLPGFPGARLLVTPPQVGLHATRRIDGIIPITYAKIMSGESYYDTAGLFAHPGGMPPRFQVSRRSMMLPDVQNLLITGRAILPAVALYSTNNQPASMKLGEEAGIMAARMVS